MGIIDTHCHLNDESYQEELETVLAKCKEEHIDKMFVIGTSLEDSKRAVELANTYDELYAIIGFYPEFANEVNEASMKELEALCISNKKVIGIGEIGLDYYWEEYPDHETQKKAFRTQIELAKKLDLPITIHAREATMETYEVLKEYAPLKGIMHCYSGSLEMAKMYMKLGMYISFAGPLTFKNARGVKECCEGLPLDHILCETDSPYLTPHPFRGKRNYPYMVNYVAETIAELHGISKEEYEKIEIESVNSLFFQ